MARGRALCLPRGELLDRERAGPRSRGHRRKDSGAQSGARIPGTRVKQMRQSPLNFCCSVNTHLFAEPERAPGVGEAGAQAVR